ncbi:MAG: hypothetical protein QJR08_06240, partial [Bacillota bacterium]|nr:hypothetical protein [Bacillota bacterium]
MLPVWRKRARLDDPFAAGGGRAWLIGAQDGGFPPLGEHDPGWMGGLWVPPLQLLAGFWLAFAEETPRLPGEEDGRTAVRAPWWLPPADLFEAAPVVPRMVWEASLADGPLAGTRVLRLHHVPPGEPGGVIRWLLQERAGKERRLRFFLLLAGSLRPGWRTAAALPGAGVAEASGEGRWSEGGPGAAAGGGRPASAVLFRRCGERATAAAAVLPAAGLAEVGEPAELDLPEEARGRGQPGLLVGRLELPAGGRARLRLAVALGPQPESAAATALRLLHEAGGQTFRARKTLAAACREGVPTGDAAWLEEPWCWAREALRLLWLENRAGEGWAAGLPEYAWWFGADTAYTVRAAWPLGRAGEARRALAFLGRLARSAGGRVPHEVVQDGRVDHPGNVQETAQWVLALAELVRATGDVELLRQEAPTLEAALGWLEAQCASGGLPRGYGMVEVAGLDAALLDSAAYAARAFQEGAALAAWSAARLPGAGEERLRALARRWRERGRSLEEAVVRLFDGPEGYADVLVRPEEAAPLLGASLARAEADAEPRLAEQLRRLLDEAQTGPGVGRRATGAAGPSWLGLRLGHWIELVPYELGLAPWPEARRRLPGLYRRFATRWGGALNAFDRRQTMTLTSGILALALARYGLADPALGLMEQVWQTAGLRTPGFPSEISPEAGCFVQAWTAYALVVPFVRGLLGLELDALRGRLSLAPRWPSGWRSMGLRGLRAGGGRLSLELEREGPRQRLRLERDGPPLRLCLRLAPPPGLGPEVQPVVEAGGARLRLRRGRSAQGSTWMLVSDPLRGGLEVALRWPRST